MKTTADALVFSVLTQGTGRYGVLSRRQLLTDMNGSMKLQQRHTNGLGRLGLRASPQVDELISLPYGVVYSTVAISITILTVELGLWPTARGW